MGLLLKYEFGFSSSVVLPKSLYVQQGPRRGDEVGPGLRAARCWHTLVVGLWPITFSLPLLLCLSGEAERGLESLVSLCELSSCRVYTPLLLPSVSSELWSVGHRPTSPLPSLTSWLLIPPACLTFLWRAGPLPFSPKFYMIHR